MLTRYGLVIVLGGIALLVLIGAALTAFWGARMAGTDTATVAASTTPGTSLKTFEGSSATAFTAPPEGSTIVINTPNGGVRVRNFFAEAISKDEGVYVFIRNDKHEIAYDSTTGSFLIEVKEQPFLVGRTRAEQALVAWLGVSQADACKLSLRLWDAKQLTGGTGSPFAPLAWSFCGKVQ
jgi:hypothetical protein